MNRKEASFILVNIDRRVCDDELNEALDVAIKALEQQPKMGHWIYKQYDGYPECGNWHCSECDEIDNRTSAYCPNCGAEMSESKYYAEMAKSFVKGFKAGLEAESEEV